MSSDHEMSEAPASASAGAFEHIHVDEDGNPMADEVLVAFNSAQNVRILPGSSDTAASFEFTGEDHTLGNALRWIVMKKCVLFLQFLTFRPLPPLSPIMDFVLIEVIVAQKSSSVGTRFRILRSQK